jgi:hypothetical protein
VFYLKQSAAPQIDAMASARGLWRGMADRAADVCTAGLERNWVIGLNYYSVTPLPECSAQTRPLWLLQEPGQAPFLEPAPKTVVDPAAPNVVLSPFRKQSK